MTTALHMAVSAEDKAHAATLLDEAHALRLAALAQNERALAKEQEALVILYPELAHARIEPAVALVQEDEAADAAQFTGEVVVGDFDAGA